MIKGTRARTRAHRPIDTMSNEQRTDGFGWDVNVCEKWRMFQCELCYRSLWTRRRIGHEKERHDMTIGTQTDWINWCMCVCALGCANAKRLCPFRFGTIFRVFFFFVFGKRLKDHLIVAIAFKCPLNTSCSPAFIDSSRIRIEQCCNEEGNPVCDCFVCRTDFAKK